jgi:GNAT superfamily N-acetyltransferase
MKPIAPTLPDVEIGDPTDFPAFIGLLEEAGQWLMDKDIAQWPPGSIAPQRALLEAFVRQGALLVARSNGLLVGGCVVTRQSYAAWDEHPGAAIYLHKLVTARRAAGVGLGAALLAEAEAFARRLGFERLRLDCWTGNAVLSAYYQERGFVECGIAPEGGTSVRLFEKRL